MGERSWPIIYPINLYCIFMTSLIHILFTYLMASEWIKGHKLGRGKNFPPALAQDEALEDTLTDLKINMPN